VALVDLRPVSVESLWQNLFESLDCGTAEPVTVVHPSWWSPPRIDVVSAAARVLIGDAEIRSRRWLLTRASPCSSATSTVEIADGFVVVTGKTVTVEARQGHVEDVAEAVALSIQAAASGTTETVLIDAPATVRGAKMLAAAIANRLPSSGGIAAIVVDDIRLRKLAGELKTTEEQNRRPKRARTSGKILRAMTVVATSTGVFVSVGMHSRHGAPWAPSSFPTAVVVEGHVALEVPAHWPMRRVVAGPGSARVQLTSPADPEVALHVTQSRVALPGLDATAEFLKNAMDAAPAGVFVDFDPAGRSAGRPVVTYREVRAGHDIRWTVWVDNAVRISIGCQSRRSRDDAVSQECQLAIRSARALK
jgi:type VII secretion-associated protein (TIGR03931 family)